MPTKPKTVRDITVANLERSHRLASYWFGSRWCPAVDTAKDGGYQIRVLAGETTRGGSTTTNYDYFTLDADGLVLSSPRGYAANYNRKVRVVDIAEAVARHAEPGGEG